MDILAPHKLVAFVGTLDARSARAFYGDVLGLPVLSEDAFAIVFDAGGTMLRVTIVQEFTPAKYTILGWEVPDVVETVKALSEAGVVFERYHGMLQDDLGIWESPIGARVAWFRDPDGNILCVTQFPATTPRP